MLETMYPAAANSRQTELAAAIDDTQTSITVLDGSFLPDAPNELVIDPANENAETILYTGKTGNTLTGVTRGFKGVAQSWVAGTKIARFFTAHDFNTFKSNIEDLDNRLGNIPAPQDASLTQKGIVQLSNATGSSSDTEAATPKAVKNAYDIGLAAQAIINNRDGYGTTTNSGNVYTVALTPAPVAYVDGLRITVKINAANTGPVSINVNGLGANSVLKSNGSDMTANALRANSVYSFVYNGTAFILQGEGGEYGTAVASDVLSGITIGTDEGIVSGTMVNQGSIGTKNLTFQNDSYTIPAGYHNGSGKVVSTYEAGRTVQESSNVSLANGAKVFANLNGKQCAQISANLGGYGGGGWSIRYNGTEITGWSNAAWVVSAADGSIQNNTGSSATISRFFATSVA